MNDKGHWYCPHCTCEVEPIEATFEERHESCGHPLEWVTGKNMSSMLFGAPAKEFYRISGRKPLKVMENRVYFTDEYVRYLENRLELVSESAVIKKLKAEKRELLLKVIKYQQKALELLDR